MTVAFFDLDRTLIDCNSGRLWLQSEVRGGRVGLRAALWASWWLFRYSLGAKHDFSQVYEAAVTTLAGEEEAALAERTRVWFREEVAHRIRPGARAALERHRLRCDQLVICSSSSIYAGRNAQEVFGLDDTVATVFEVVDGRFTGVIAASALGEEKALRAEAWAADRGIRLEDCFFYTDSVTDLALLERVGHPVVVNPDRALSRIARARAWSVEDWGVHQ